MTDDPYTYSGSAVLKNRFDIRNADDLDRVERRFSIQRQREGCPSGRFDLTHLQAIHRHLFQDVYDWAGDIRLVEITKDSSQFQFRKYIETGMADVHSRLLQARFLRGLDADSFAIGAGEIIADVNYVHPFREGNGRTQLQYLKQLCAQAGHPLDLTALDPTLWQAASRAAHQGEFSPMAAQIRRAIKTG